MAEVTTTQTFTDGETVTAAKLNNITANASIGAEVITNRSELISVDGASDFVLGYDTSASGLRKIKLNNVLDTGSVSTSKIADGAVTSVKMADGSVTSSKIATLSPNPEGTFGGSNSIPTIIVNNKGQITSVSTSVLVADSFSAGMIMEYAGTTAPSKWSICDGSAVSRSTYATLFSAIGTTYGTGNGSTTFNLPDLRGRSPIGAGTGSGLTTRALASTGGAESVTLATTQIPSHQHTGQKLNSSQGAGTTGFFAGTSSDYSMITQPTGGGQSHSNMQPFIALNYIIYHGV